MKWFKLFLTKVWRWFVLNKKITSIKFAMHGLNAKELELLEKLFAADLTVDEIIHLFKNRRLKNKLVQQLKDAGYTDSQIEEILKEYKNEILFGKAAEEILKEIKSKHSPK